MNLRTIRENRDPPVTRIPVCTPFVSCTYLPNVILPQEVAFDGPTTLGDKLWMNFGADLGLPYIEKGDLCLLDEAIAMLNPPEAQVRVIEVETVLVRGRTLLR